MDDSLKESSAEQQASQNISASLHRLSERERQQAKKVSGLNENIMLLSEKIKQLIPHVSLAKEHHNLVSSLTQHNDSSTLASPNTKLFSPIIIDAILSALSSIMKSEFSISLPPPRHYTRESGLLDLEISQNIMVLSVGTRVAYVSFRISDVVLSRLVSHKRGVGSEVARTQFEGIETLMANLVVSIGIMAQDICQEFEALPPEPIQSADAKKATVSQSVFTLREGEIAVIFIEA